ncbi:MAG TPA: alpha/beta hydrolase, partial [Acidimicrobiales bacterium]|nr:alpha/beta hydrolase [Acidimicrobiales bacterium]
MPYFLLRGLSMYYEIHGEGEPFVLILGLGSDITNYDWMIEELAKHYRVIAFDNRGAGRTDKPEDGYSIEQMTDDLEGLLERLSVSNARVLGISLGSRIAVDLAVRYPQRVKDLILASVLARRVVEKR